MKTITLGKKVVHEGRDYLAMEVDEPSVGGVEAYENAKAAGESDMAAMIKMMAFETGWPLDAVRKIKASDMVKISEAFAPFVETAGATGE